MLPSMIRDTYKSYKLDTDAFTTWLCNQARARGYKTQSSSAITTSGTLPGSARLKGKARKKAQENQKASASVLQSKVPTRDLLLQADFVNNCKKPEVRVPYDIQRILYRAITFRKKCSAYFAAFESEAIQESTSKHHFFTQILETVQEKLRTKFESPPKNRTSKPNHDTSRSTMEDANFVNSFAALSTSDTEPDFEVTLETVEMMTEPISKSKEPFRVYELEQEVEDDLPFLVWCMFSDVQAIHEYIIGIWKEYKVGNISIETAALLTHISIDMVKQLEVELVKVCPVCLSFP